MANRHSRFGLPLPKADLKRDMNPALLAIQDEIDALAPTNQIGFYHSPIVTASFFSGLPGTTPAADAKGALIYLVFAGADAAFRQFKVPNTFAGNPAFHIHWTKSGDQNELGKAARWRVSYVVFPSNDTTAGNGTASPTVAEIEDVYTDSGTTTRLVHRTASVPMVGLVVGYYVSLKIEITTPVGSALASSPALFSVDLTYDQYLNKTLPDS